MKQYYLTVIDRNDGTEVNCYGPATWAELEDHCPEMDLDERGELPYVVQINLA